MVYEDIGASFDLTSKSKKNEQKMAPIQDRILSSLIDFSLFSPIITLFLSSPLKTLHWRYFIDPGSIEFFALLLVVGLGYFGLSLLIQSLFWSVLGATPGQLFCHIRVIDSHTMSPPRLAKAAMRSFFFLMSVLLLGIPFLEVFSHRERRCWYDRISDTDIMTLKKVGLRAPIQEERMTIFAVFFFVFMLSLFGSSRFVQDLYSQARQANFQESSRLENQELCSEVSSDAGYNRLDMALAFFLAKSIDEECLTLETDFAFWKGQDLDRAWASLIMANRHIKDKKLSENYFKQTCLENNESMPCRLAMLQQDKKMIDSNFAKESISAGILLLNHKQSTLQSRKEVFSYLQTDILKKAPELNDYMQIQKITILHSSGEFKRAEGALDVVWDTLNTDLRLQLGENICENEIRTDCSNHAFFGCQKLAQEFESDASLQASSEAMRLMSLEKKCRNLPLNRSPASVVEIE